jgi:drug/metabolite transporter (DMT)-like permease
MLPVLITIFCWAAEYVLIKEACEQVRPLEVASVTTLVAALLYGLLLAVRRPATPRIPSRPKAFPWGRILLIGLIGTAVNLFWIWGTSLTTAANAAALGRTNILFALFLSTVFFHERIRVAALMMAPVILAGVYLTTDISFRAFSISNYGDVLILASTFLLIVNAGIIKGTMRLVSVPVIAGCNMTINALLFLTASMLLSGRLNVIGGIAFQAWLLLLLCGLCVFLTLLAYYSTLKALPVWEAFLLFLLVPVLTTLFAWGVRHELPSVRQGVGMLLILLGAAGIIVSRRRELAAL